MTNGLKEAKRAITEACEALKTSDAIPRAIDTFRDFLLEKNKAYGNSIYEPVRVFTNASIETLILVRLNDKATRLLKGESGGEDSFDDLLGYLILRKALPLYLESKEADECADANPRTIPGSVVTESLKNRGLRVGMTFQEVRDNQWTQCDAQQDNIHAVGPCSASDPCSACKFLDGALCKCGHPYTVHTLAMSSTASDCMTCNHDQCLDFSLASWTDEPLPQVATNIANAVNAAGVPWTAIPFDDGSEFGAVVVTASKVGSIPNSTHGSSEGVRTQSEERNRDLAAEAARVSKPRINRATWHESDDGKHAIDSVLGFLIQQPIVSWTMGELTKKSGLDRSGVQLSVAHLLSTGAVVNHGKAKGTRYAVAGFTDWPAPLPRGKKTDDQFADEEPSPIIGAHGAT